MTHDTAMRSRWCKIALAAAVSLLLKCALLAILCLTGTARRVLPDSAGYEDSARALLHTGHFAVSPEAPERPQLMRTPGYPVFIALVYLACGERRGALILAQIAVSVLTILLASRMAREGWGPRAGAAAAVVLALDPVSFAYAGLLLSETLFAFLICLSAYAGMRFALSGGVGCLLLAGLALALATLVRPIGYYLIIPVLLWTALFAARAGMPPGRIAFCCVALAIPWAVLVGGWQLRNLRVAGSAEFSQITGLSLLHYKAAGVVAMRDGIPLDEARTRLRARLPASVSPAEASRAACALGLSTLREHPRLALKSAAHGAAKTLCVPGEYELLNYCGADTPPEGCLGDLVRLSPRAYAEKWMAGRKGEFAAFLLSSAYLLVVGICVIRSLAGVRGMGREARWSCGLLLLVVSYLVAASAGPESGPRFRVPAMPLLSILAACRLAARTRRDRPGEKDRAPAATQAP